MASTVLLIGNPSARSGGGAAEIGRARRRMQARGWTVEVLETVAAGGTVERVRDAAWSGTHDTVASLGGDGTFHDVACGLLAAGARTPLGLLPAGTANDQAKSLGVPSVRDDLDGALDIIAAGHLLQLDVGHVARLEADGRATAGSLFFDSVGWGLQADILARRNRDRRRVARHAPLVGELYRDEAVYAGAAMRGYLASFVEPTKFDARVVADGEASRFSRVTDVVISATAVYAGSWVLDRSSRPDDGRFELVPFRGRRELFARAIGDLHRTLWRHDDLERLGMTRSPSVVAAAFELHFETEGQPHVAAQVDGEEWLPGLHYRVAVEEHRLPVLTPDDFAPPWRRHDGS